MSSFRIDTASIEKEIKNYSVFCSNLYLLNERLKNIRNNVASNYSAYSGVISSLGSCISDVNWCRERLDDYADAGRRIAYNYSETDRKLAEKSDFSVHDLAWDSIKKALGTSGKIIGIIENITKGKFWDSGKDIIKIVGKVWQNTKGSKVSWGKVFDIFSDKNPLEDAIGTYFDFNKPKQTACNWLAEIYSSLRNNYNEFGSIANPRFWGETATETGISVLEGIGVGTLVTAGFALIGVTSAPAWIVAGVTGAATYALDWGLNKLFSWCTGGSQADWKEAVSDWINDGVEYVGSKLEGVVDSVENVVGKAGNAFINGIGSLVSWVF